MASWSKDRVEPNAINGGREFTTDDNLALNELNAIVNNSFYASEKSAEAVEKINNVIKYERGSIITANGVVQAEFNADLKADKSALDETKSKLDKKTEVIVDGNHVDSLSFGSDPQTQINSLGLNKADKDLSNVTYPEIVADGVAKTGVCDRVVESFVSSDGLTWYRKWASGWKECGVMKSGGETTKFTLPIEFTTTNYTVTATLYEDRGNVYLLQVSSRTTSEVTTDIGDTRAILKGIYCCGY